jgi:D-alanyl-D-alanine carboxypeptidase/D-alanyl-D-alanine-endopeptidase (penicillin-binding protein 4)
LVDEAGGNLRGTIGDMLKFSNNFVAEMLTKTLSVHDGASPGNMEKGVQVIIRTMEKTGINKSEFGFVSPSGLSKANLMTANHFIKLLKYVTKSSYAPEFWSGLPLAGKDGTLKGRMKGLSVRAKTGLLNGVSGLSGMVQRTDGNYLFAFMYNGSKHFEARDFFDHLCAELSK